MSNFGWWQCRWPVDCRTRPADCRNSGLYGKSYYHCLGKPNALHTITTRMDSHKPLYPQHGRHGHHPPSRGRSSGDSATIGSRSERSCESDEKMVAGTTNTRTKPTITTGRAWGVYALSLLLFLVVIGGIAMVVNAFGQDVSAESDASGRDNSVVTGASDVINVFLVIFLLYVIVRRTATLQRNLKGDYGMAPKTR